MKGIIMAGGQGNSLLPLTKGMPKQLLPVYDKPMIYYPLTTLMLAKIKDILVITSSRHDEESFKKLLDDGKQFGISLKYAIQSIPRGSKNPKGFAEAFTIGKEFIGDDKVALIIGDNLFHGSGLGMNLQLLKDVEGCRVFAYPVKKEDFSDLKDLGENGYGVVKIDERMRPVSLARGITTNWLQWNPKFDFLVPGLYFYDNSVVQIAEDLAKKKRYGIMDVNEEYLNGEKLQVSVLPENSFWTDAGTFEGLRKAINYIGEWQEEKKKLLNCPEEVAWRVGFINGTELRQLAEKLSDNDYKKYLLGLLGE